MKNISFSYLLIFVGMLNGCRSDRPLSESYIVYLEDYRTRAATVVHHFDTTAARNYYSVAAKYAAGTNVLTADSMFLDLLKEPRGDMFWMFPVIGAYLHGKNEMSEEVNRAVRDAWRTYAPYRGDTENHWCMYYASLYLAAEQWPGLPGSAWFNGKSSEENLEESREYLIHWVKITTTIGQGEFDSPDYLPEYVIPMVLLAEFAEDKSMRKRAAMMTDYLLADFAVDHLEGQYVGGFSRVTEPAVYQPLRGNASAFAYLYFGTGIPSLSGWILFPALAAYRLPEIIYDVATDRNRTYVHRERKRVRNAIRFAEEKNPPVYKYTYMTEDYALGSLQGGILQPIQQHTWSVRFTDGSPYTAVFGLHPYWSGYELAMFFPQRVKTLVADVVPSKSTYNSPDKWTGGSPYERTFQYRNTLLVLYDIPEGTNSGHISGYFPRNLEQLIRHPSGWILAQAGRTYIGWYPLQPYEWMEEESNWRLRSRHRQNGYVVEVRSETEIGSFDNFIDVVGSLQPEAELQDHAVSLRYRNAEGHLMEFAFPDRRKLDNNPVDLSGYELFEGPHLNASVGSEMLTITYGNRKRTLDFKRLRIYE